VKKSLLRLCFQLQPAPLYQGGGERLRVPDARGRGGWPRRGHLRLPRGHARLRRQLLREVREIYIPIFFHISATENSGNTLRWTAQKKAGAGHRTPLSLSLRRTFTLSLSCCCGAEIVSSPPNPRSCSCSRSCLSLLFHPRSFFFGGGFAGFRTGFRSAQNVGGAAGGSGKGGGGSSSGQGQSMHQQHPTNPDPKHHDNGDNDESDEEAYTDEAWLLTLLPTFQPHLAHFLWDELGGVSATKR